MSRMMDRLEGLRRVVLVTADAHELYRPLGFDAIARPQDFMELWQPDIYQEQP